MDVKPEFNLEEERTILKGDYRTPLL